MIKMYTTPNCRQCALTEKQFTRLQIPIEKIDVTQNQAAYDYVISLGYRSMPVVVDGDRHWSGFDPESIALCQK